MSWIEKDDKLMKTFKAENFSDLTSKLNLIAAIADEMDHHPDFRVWGYNKIEFALSTHTSNSVSDLDHKLAEKIDTVFA
ncbi:MAG: 4a-hydroxytetrahydrobiopterin dehydratase [Arenicella sp.]|jgi:4a-hydroxytetrahydrobiopterin dehydratase